MQRKDNFGLTDFFIWFVYIFLCHVNWRQLDLYDWVLVHLKFVVFVCVSYQEIFGALHIIGKLGFC